MTCGDNAGEARFYLQRTPDFQAIRSIRTLAARLHVKSLLLTGLTGLLAASTLTGCVVMGTSSRGGFFFWPGGLGLVVLVLLVLFVLRRR